MQGGKPYVMRPTELPSMFTSLIESQMVEASTTSIRLSNGPSIEYLAALGARASPSRLVLRVVASGATSYVSMVALT